MFRVRGREGRGLLNTGGPASILSPLLGSGTVPVEAGTRPPTGKAALEHLISPVLLYGACAIGALGVLVALPRERLTPAVFGAILLAGAFGALVLGLGFAAPDQVPNFHFYIFSLIALLASLRVISHPRPIYSALYFILTILAACGLYLILSAEFLAFALIIVYAGAILITYLFVIMLATEGPTADQVEALNEYDRVAREPVLAAGAGFIVLAALTTLLVGGSTGLKADPRLMPGDTRLAVMPQKVNDSLRAAGLIKGDEGVIHIEKERRWGITPRRDGNGTLYVADKNGLGASTRLIPQAQWPADLRLSNTEGVAFSLIDGHPGAIEIAGVILLMAMLGAVVLARKKVELDEAAKAQAQRHARLDEPDVAGVTR